MIKKRKFKKTMSKKLKKTRVKKLPPGTYHARVTNDNLAARLIISGVNFNTLGLQVQQPEKPKTLKAALERITELEELHAKEKREHENVLKDKDLECKTLRLQMSDHVMNRVLNILEEGSKKGNFPVRNG